MAIKIRKRKKIKSADRIKDIQGLEAAIKDALTADLCVDLVDLAYSEDNYFDDDVFVDADTFWDVHDNDDVKDIILKFFNGEDLDSKGPANPNRTYFRFDGYDNIESTDYPGDIYLNELDTEIVDYVLDHLEDREFPEQIQNFVNEYLEYTEE